MSGVLVSGTSDPFGLDSPVVEVSGESLGLESPVVEASGKSFGLESPEEEVYGESLGLESRSGPFAPLVLESRSGPSDPLDQLGLESSVTLAGPSSTLKAAKEWFNINDKDILY